MICFPCSALIFSAWAISRPGRHFLDRDRSVDREKIQGSGDSQDHLARGSDDEQAGKPLRGKRLPHLGDQLGIREHGGLDCGEDALLTLGGPAGDDFLTADEEPIVDDEVDPETAGNLARLEALAGAALAHERKHPPPSGQPREYAPDDSDGIHLTGKYTPVAPGDYGAAQAPAAAGNMSRRRRSCRR